MPHPLAPNPAPAMSSSPRRGPACRWLRRFLFVLGLVPLGLAAAEPVTFVFRLPDAKGNPYLHEVWAEVITPAQQTRRLPVFFAGGDRFAVRARAEAVGDYRLGRVTEVRDGAEQPVKFKLVGRDRVRVTAPQTLPPVRTAAGAPARFAFPDGSTYQPIGTNLAWAPQDRAQYFLRALPRFRAEGLNWVRIWMAHWSGLNLEWLPPDMGASPPVCILDQRVAADWDRIIAAAEDAGVYVQLVLQHHGQYSTTVNPNWDDNPWNAARPGGFLKTPAEFFTSETARGLTGLKYRYIVARWGYSPAILAWELFNEVHWVDAYRIDHDEAAVAQWHAAMAGYLRQVDPYHHLVTTSIDTLRTPIYAAMDYLQPHLYAANPLAAVRTFAPVPAKINRPVFYGEVGDDHQPLTPEQKKSGVALVPPVWASMMGTGRHAAQPWLGWDLLATDRLGELGAVARFLAATQLGARDGLQACSAVVESAARVPHIVAAAQVWQRRPAPTLAVPADGRETLAAADVPRQLVFDAARRAEGFADRATFQLDFPEATTVRARVGAVGPPGGALRFTLDDQVVAEPSWAADAGFPAEVAVPVPAGPHALVVANVAGPDWVQLDQLDLGRDTSALAAIGRRDDTFLALWLWRRDGVFAVEAPAPAVGTLVLDDVPAGTWQVTWWDTLAGTPAAPVAVEHGGGPLRLPTPPIARHAAVVLTR